MTKLDTILYSNLTLLQVHWYTGYQGRMRIDAASMVNLELLAVETGERHGSLLSALDACRSDAGRRLLRGWLCRPLVDIEGIVRRQDAVQEILSRPELLDPLFAAMRACPDLERCAIAFCYPC